MTDTTFAGHGANPDDPYIAAPDRYDGRTYRRAGRSGLRLPPVSFGLWHNFGDDRDLSGQRAIVRHAFDNGIVHFDLAAPYGPPRRSAEENFGRILRKDLGRYRDELVISSKAGWGHGTGPHGNGSSRKALIASAERSLRDLGLDHVDVFYSHHEDLETPLEETIGALDALVRQGKALYVGLSNYTGEDLRRATEIAHDLGTPITVVQPPYSLLNRWAETSLLPSARDAGVGVVAYVPLAQGLLTDRYLDPARRNEANKRFSFDNAAVTDDLIDRVGALARIAERRGQTLAQLALAWVLRDDVVTTALTGASSTAQLDSSIRALDASPLDQTTLDEIDGIVAGLSTDPWTVAVGR